MRATDPIRLYGQRDGFRVERGHLDVFAVRLQGGAPAGRRRHVCRLEPGQAAFATDGVDGFGLIAVLAAGSEAAPVDPAAMGPDAYAHLVDGWVLALAHGAFHEAPPKASLPVEPGDEVEVEAGACVRSRGDVVWAQVREGEAHLSGRPEAPAHGGFVPLGSRPWLVTAAPSVIGTASTLDRIADPDFEADLAAYQAGVLQVLAADVTRETVDEAARVRRRAESSQAAMRRGMGHLASILMPEGERTGDSKGDRLLTATRTVGRALGVRVKEPRAGSKARRKGEQLAAIARASRLRTRQVILRGKWWRADAGPLLVMIGAEGEVLEPAALVPGKRGYVLHDPVDGSRCRVTASVAERVHPVAFTFYRPFPNRALSAFDVFRFGIHGGGRDALMLLAAGLAAGVLGLLTPIATGAIFETAIPESDRVQVLHLVVALLAAAAGTGAFHLARGFALLRIESRMDVAVQAAVWDRLLDLPTTFFRRFTAGELAVRAGAVSSIRRILSGATITSILSAAFSVLYVGLMAWYSLHLTLFAVGLTAVALATTLVSSWVQLRHQRRAAEVQSRLQGRVLQIITGLTKLRVAGAEAAAFSRWADDFGAQRRSQYQARQAANGLGTFNAVFPILGSLVLFAVVAGRAGPPLLPVGDFVAFQAAFGAFTAAALSLSGSFTAVLAAVPLYEQARPLLAALPEVDASKADPGELEGSLEVQHASFRYHPEGDLVLHDVSLRADPGEFIALVGPSGSGKSTVLRLLLGFETPEAGAVAYDEHDLLDVNVQAVRRQIGVVMQNGGLMQGDIFTNIVGSGGGTHEDAWQAARMAGLDADIHEMPMGMHTVVSEGGSTLSGGQRQRLLIARAIVNRPRILLFDEATSALDNRTQAVVSASLDGLEATRIVVAHRMSTIQNADRIYVLDKGRVVQVGTYAELMARPGLFADLASRQMS